MAEFLLEILAEEIPAGVLPQARNDLLRGLADALADERIEGTFFIHSTSRRLVLFSRDLPEMQDDHEVRGRRPVRAASPIDADGTPDARRRRVRPGTGRRRRRRSGSCSTPKGEYVSVRRRCRGALQRRGHRRGDLPPSSRR